MRLSTRILLVVALTASAGIGATLLAVNAGRMWNMSGFNVSILAAFLVSPMVVWSARLIVAPLNALYDDLGNALRATRDGDTSLRLVVRGNHEVAELRRLYNELADATRSSRQALHDKGILLDTILQRTPVGVILLNPDERVMYSNVTARKLIADGFALDGRTIGEITASVKPSLGEALRTTADTIFQIDDETFHVTQRLFRIHAQQHRLILLERLTGELRRQEVTVWKKAIRVINHEINNSIAPISSLFHSAKRAQEMPEQHHRINEIYDLISERFRALGEFLESYAQFARLPEPRKEKVSWVEVIDAVRALYSFRLEGEQELEAALDRAQIERVLINLVKNAHESGSDPEEIVVSIQQAGRDSVIAVLDRGRGMSEDVMRQALVPFYTTKPGGSGMGLALSNEIVEAHGGQMRLSAREEGGTEVTCWLPVD